MYHNRQSFIALTFKQMPVPKIVAVLWGVHVCVAIAAILLCTLDNRAYERRCWERCYLQGVEALSRGQFDQARSWQELALKEAVALKDDHFRRGRTFCELAAIAYGQGDARLAVSMYRNAIEQLLHACGQLEGPAQELALREASVARSGLIESLVLQ
ncbi:MAG: hypothetical protein K2Z81_08710, partial [Cyanobacteria bacterium]|nr:hypothetical protein [Cyanobacteriota bacterium]